MLKKIVITSLIWWLWYIPFMYTICKFIDWFVTTKLFNDVFDKIVDHF